MDKEMLFRYIQGDASEREREQIAEWLDADHMHMREYMAMHMGYDAIMWNDTKGVSTGKANSGKVRKLITEMLKVASVLLVAFIAAKFLIPRETDQPVIYQTLHIPEGQRAEIVLSDNTKVWINSKSTLVFPNRFRKNERSVELTGEAYFDVAHNEKMPFTVRTGDYDIKVLGTEFDVKSYPELNLFEVSLIEGSVAVRSLDGGQEIMLSPDQKAYARDGRLVLGGLNNHNHLLWREGIISFDAETFGEILSKLELYYDVNIRVGNRSIMDETYTGKFWIKDGVEHVLKVLQLNHKFKYHKDDMNNITIY